MTHEREAADGPLYTQVEVGAGPYDAMLVEPAPPQPELARLLRELIKAQDRQNELLEELVGTVAASHRQRAGELQQWRQANPRLVQDCRKAGEVLGRVQSGFLKSLAQDVSENAEALTDGDYYLGEFLDRYGHRLAHLNCVLQVLGHLAGPQERS